MTTLRRLSATTALALGTTLALAACGDDSSSSSQVTLVDWGSQGGPRPWATPGLSPNGTPERKAVLMPRLTMTPDDKGNVPSGQWPDAKDLLTKEALTAMFPDGKDVETTDCGRGAFEDDPGARTEKDSHCVIAVALPNDQGGKSKMKLSIRAAGADDSLTENFAQENGDALNSDKAKDSSTDRVWKNGAWGSKRMVKSGSEYRFVVSDGHVAVYYVASFDGFFVLGQSMSDRQRGVETQLLPIVVKDLAWRLPAAS